MQIKVKKKKKERDVNKILKAREQTDDWFLT